VMIPHVDSFFPSEIYLRSQIAYNGFSVAFYISFYVLVETKFHMIYALTKKEIIII